MGEAYRAHDTRLDREVAIKVLPASPPPTPIACATESSIVDPSGPPFLL